MPRKTRAPHGYSRISPDSFTSWYKGREPRALRLRLSRVAHEMNIRSLVGHGPRVTQETIRAAALSAYLDAVEKKLGLPPLPLS